MAKGASKCLFLFLLSVLIVCSSGTLVGFSIDARKSNANSSLTETVSFLKLNKVSPSQIRVFVADHRVLNSLSNTSVSVDLYLNETQVENLRNYVPSAISWLKTHLLTFLPHVNIQSITVSSSSNDSPRENELPLLLSALKSIHSILGSFHLDREVKVLVALSLPILENLNQKHKRDLHRIFDFINRARSYFIVKANIDDELSMGDKFVESVVSATLAASALPCNDVSMVLTVKSSAVPSAIEAAEFSDKISRSLENRTQIRGKIIGMFAEVSPIRDFHPSHRELLNNYHYKTIQHDSVDPPTIFPTTPIANPATTPVTVPQDNPAPTIVTVPSTNPVTVTPTPASTPVMVPSTPVTVPSTTPVPLPSTNPVSSPLPITNPVTTPSTVPGAPAVTNPVTTYPAPSGGVPVTTPVTNPVAPPAVSGQSWCVAKTGASETAIQAALDYACGIGGADCSTIQQGGSCYNPITLQNHASFAFNSYYQKNPVQSSCDFGGTAMITNINPSTGSCIYPSSASPSSAPLTTYPTPTTSSSGPPVAGSGSPPTVLNTSNPASGTTTVFGDSTPGVNASTSVSTDLQPFIGCIILVTSIITGKIILDM